MVKNFFIYLFILFYLETQFMFRSS